MQSLPGFPLTAKVRESSTMIPSLRLLAIALFTLILCPSTRGETPDDPRHRSQRKERPSAKQIEQEREWIQVDKTSSAALQAYIDKKPRGSRYKEANQLLPIVTKLEAVIAGREKPLVVIPLEPFGYRDPAYAKKRAVAISYNPRMRVGKDVGVCWTYASIDFEDCSSSSKGNFAASQYASYPGTSQFGPGSLIAFDSGGERPPSEQLDEGRRKVPLIVTARGRIAYFGLVENIGWVHLAGEGEVVYPDGKNVRFR